MAFCKNNSTKILLFIWYSNLTEFLNNFTWDTTVLFCKIYTLQNHILQKSRKKKSQNQNHTCTIYVTQADSQLSGSEPRKDVLRSKEMVQYTPILLLKAKKRKKNMAEMAAIGVNSKGRRWNKLKKETENLS